MTVWNGIIKFNGANGILFFFYKRGIRAIGCDEAVCHQFSVANGKWADKTYMLPADKKCGK